MISIRHLVDADAGAVIAGEVLAPHAAGHRHLVLHVTLLLANTRVDLPPLPEFKHDRY